jgi:alpha-2-macroglobulin
MKYASIRLQSVQIVLHRWCRESRRQLWPLLRRCSSLALFCRLGSLVLLALLLAGCRPQANVAEHVELVADLEHPGPAMTFELRFERPMVKAAQIGLPAAHSPLVITPSVPGRFTWLSARSGTFTPTEALKMETRYALRLAGGLLDAEGQPVRARLQQTLRTPLFALHGFLPSQSNANASAEPEVRLVFNAAVAAASANHFIEFRDAQGRSVAAEVRQGTLEELPASYEFGGGVSLRTWSQEFADRQLPSTRKRSAPEEASDSETNTVPNFLIASAHQPLPIGQGWQLVLDAGLPAAEANLRLRERQLIPIGDVTPLTLLGTTTHNTVNHTPSVTLTFSKALALSLTNSIAEWVAVEPRPTNLVMQVRGAEVVLEGDFKSEMEYIFTIRAGLPAAEPFTLAQAQTLKGTVPRVEPRLYFPAFSSEQLAKGNRSFPLLAVNVPKVHLRAKLLDPQTALYALRGYESYFRSWRDRPSSEERYRRIEYNLVPGRTVFNEEVSGNAQSDVVTNLVFHWDTVLNGRKTGLLFLDAERATDPVGGELPLGTQALIQLTDLGVVWKSAPAQVQAFVFSHSTGQPVAGAAVKLLGDENEALGQAVTGSDGMARLTEHTNAQWLAVQLGEDFHAVEFRKHTLPLYAFHLPSVEWNGAEDPRRVLLFADRGLYRPGETLQLKAIARDWSDQGLTIPASLSGTLVCNDARDRKFFETNVNLSALGSLAVAVPLTSEARGTYRAVLHLEKGEYSYAFQVQDFQPSAFEINLQPKPAYGPDEPLAVPLSARYYFGKPLSQAQVKWSLQAQDTEFAPKAFAGFSFGRSAFESRFGHGSSVVNVNGQEKLACTTNHILTPRLALNASAPQPRTAALLVEVTDINQQTLSRQVEFIQHSSEFYLGLKQAGEVHSAGKELPLEIVAVGNEGQPWRQPVTAQLKLQRIEWQPVRLLGAGRSVRFRNQAVFTNVAERVVQVQPAAAPAKTGEAISGTSLSGLIPLQAGQYLIEATATDSTGHAVVSSLEFTVAAPEKLAWDYRNDVQLTLKPDRAVYAPGETAQVLVEAPFSGMALVTVERDKVLRSFTAPLEGNAPVLRVPIAPGDTPNLFISVLLVRGSDACPRQVKEPEYRLGYCHVAVEDPRQHLAVKVSTPATNYLPAQSVAVDVAVKDSLGAAVADAEVTLYAVDEGVLSLSGTEIPEPYAFFYVPRPLGVESGISLPNLLEEDPEQLQFSNKGYWGGDGDAERVRKNFLACAFWKASLRTDAEGRIQAAFPAPDSVTRYRLVALAHTRQSQFGASQAAFAVSKPLLVEPALPRFANMSDHVLARAVVYNQTARAGEVEVTLALDAHAKATDPAAVLTRRVAVAAHSSAAVEFPLEFVETGTAKWVWRGRFAEEPAGGFTDAVQSTLEVGYPAPLLRQVLLTKAAPGAEADLLAQARPQLLAGQGSITVELANSRLIGLSEAVAGLLHYPYGCAEQTSSSLLPWILLHDQPQWAPLLCGGTNDPAKVIRSGVARLFSMQTQSGGLGYWPRDREPMFWASAYGGMVLALAERHGVALPQEDFGKLLNYLSTRLRSTNAVAAASDDLCLAAYALALAGRAEPAYHEKLFGLRDQLSLEGRVLLALAISESQGSREMTEQLLAATAGARPSTEDPFGSPARQKAIRLLACVCARSDAAGVDGWVADLMNEQKEGQWTTTQGNAWALLALTEYGRRIEGTAKACAGELLCGTEAFPFRLEGTNHVFSRTFPVKPGEQPPAVRLKNNQGTAFTSTTLAVRPQLALQPRQDQGFNLSRRYQRLNDNNQAGEPNALRVGDRVLVTLRLEVRQPAQFVAVEDALPANLEAIHSQLKGQQTQGESALEVNDGDYWSNDFQEIRTDRVLFFNNAVQPGHYVLRYLARVRAAATATAPAAKVEEMYHPDRYGLSDSQALSSQPME